MRKDRDVSMRRTPKRSGIVGRFRAFLPPVIEPSANFGFKTAIRGLVVTPVLRQVCLIDPSTLEVMAVLIALAVTELFRTAVAPVAQVFGHRQSAAGANVLARLAQG